MTKPFSAEDCLALVEQSPRAVAVHDKAAWLAIFSREACVEDPVGSAPHHAGTDGERLGRFYETFIAPNDIQFHVDNDIVCGLHVMRDITIEIVMSSDVTVHVPVHLLYELTDEGGELKIARLAAHWELRPMLKQQMDTGWPFVKVGSASGGRMLRQLGVGGMLGFARALSGVGDAGKQQLVRFAEFFNGGHAQALQGLFFSHAATIAFPLGVRRLSPAECAATGGELRFCKVLAAGNVVSASCVYLHEDSRHDGVALFTLDAAGLKITDLCFYWQE